MNMIRDRIAFASKVDVTRCPDVQAFIQAKVNHEAFLEWARTPERRSLRPDTNVYERWSPAALYSLVRSMIP